MIHVMDTVEREHPKRHPFFQAVRGRAPNGKAITLLIWLVVFFSAAPMANGAAAAKDVEPRPVLKCLFQSQAELHALGARWRKGQIKFAPGFFGDSLARGQVTFQGMGARLRPERGTIEMWIRAERVPTDPLFILFVNAHAVGKPKSRGSCMRVQATPNGVSFMLSEAGSLKVPVPWSDKRWHHLALTWVQNGRLTFRARVDGKARGQRVMYRKIKAVYGDIRVKAGGNGGVQVSGLRLFNAVLPATTIRARASGPRREGPVLRYGSDVLVEAEAFPRLKGAKPVKNASASGGGALLMTERAAFCSVFLELKAGAYFTFVRGFPPSADKDACSIRIASPRTRHFRFGGERERMLTVVVRKTGRNEIALIADARNTGNVIDRVMLVRQPFAAEQFQLAALPESPARRDADTTFLATFDKGNVDADFSIVNGRADHDARRISYVPGKQGKAVLLAGIGPYGRIRGNSKKVPVVNLLYTALQNVPSRRATIEFWVKSQPGRNIWADGRDHVFFNMYSRTPVSLQGQPLNRGFPVELRKIGAGDSLMFECGPGRVSLSVADLDPGKWHHVAASWDTTCEPQRMWLTVNGKGKAAAWPQRVEPAEFVALHFGNAASHRVNYPLGAGVDDLKITNVPLSYRTKEQAVLLKQLAVDDDLAMRAEDALRKCLDRVMALQVEGGWAVWYQYPSLLPAAGSVYRMPMNPFKVKLKYGGPVGTARLFLRAYEILGDERYLRAAQRTGQFFLEAQQPGGYWTRGYSLTYAGPHPYPERFRDWGRIQDGYQGGALRYLVHLYRVTRDPAYLKAIRKSADFFLAAQNENGSWPGNYYWSKKQGVTSNQPGKGPGGGEFNDGAMTDPFSALILVYHVTKDEKYLKPLVAAANWIIESKIKGPPWGWAQQYDLRNRPVKARQHEAAAVAPRVLPFHVAKIMFWAYALTRDKKYPLAMEDVLEWMRKVEDPKRGWFMYYSMEDGKPCYSVGHKEYPWHDDPKKNIPKPTGFAFWTKYRIKRIEDAIAKVKAGTYKFPERVAVTLSDKELLKRRREAARHTKPKVIRERIEEMTRTQAPEGVWVVPMKQAGTGHGPHASYCGQARRLLNYLQNVRMAKGQIPKEFIPRGAQNKHISSYGAWYAEDWFDTPLRKKRP